MTMLSGPTFGDELSRALLDAQRGDQVAWETVFRECYPKVRRVVRRRLDRSMRSLYDSTDFASDVMKSLAANINHLSFPSVESLIAFLAHVAEQKVIDEYRRQHALKRDISRDRRLVPSDPDEAPVQLPSAEPTASQLAQANEVHERLLARRDETERAIIQLRREGHTTADIAESTGWNIRKVQRFLKDLFDTIRD
ncbi:RNA polymerase sigma factor SigD [Aquisphaera giovannonii]|uniref:RNA polymerase sigma factor SigD n=1 Tax=Aquisphaera giovannonii TaxID=406548 RepID=A0A5B9W1M8_9BACT|nr:sigma-70 family RNA polymerase sigma factor [Aquisphaera giovannonii]QEH34134.1 RNA polymerase sigma factor SigD [Aquisphaera giovannonii]